jgi:hypothetical protein
MPAHPKELEMFFSYWELAIQKPEGRGRRTEGHRGRHQRRPAGLALRARIGACPRRLYTLFVDLRAGPAKRPYALNGRITVTNTLPPLTLTLPTARIDPPKAISLPNFYIYGKDFQQE